MERTKTIVCIFLILILVQLIIFPVSAVTLTFLDNAYLQGNDYTIKDNTGSLITNFTGSSSAVLNEGKSYSVLFSPKGLFDLSKEGPNNYSSLGILGAFLQKNVAGLIVIGLVLGIVVMRRH